MMKRPLLLIAVLLFGLMGIAYANNGSRYFDGINNGNAILIGDMTAHLYQTFTFETWFKPGTLLTGTTFEDNTMGGHSEVSQWGRTIFASSGTVGNWPAWLSLKGNTLVFYGFQASGNSPLTY